MTDQADRPKSLAARIDAAKSQPLSWKAVASRAAAVAIAGVAIYLVLPTITEVLASWPRLSTLNPWWLTLAIGAQAAHFTCTFALQRLALRTRQWFPVVTSQLAGNAITLIMPGGAAVGAAVQFRMLAVSGSDTAEAVGALASYSLLGVGGLLALPVLALPVILLGSPVNRGLVNAAVLGAAGFVVFAAFGAVLLAYDAPLRWAGGAAQRAANLVRRKRPPVTGLADSLVEQRNEIRAVLGEQWWQALLLSAGRLAFDYLCLLACLRATGSRPRPSLILVAYAVAGIIAMIPITPGGLGLVEASLTGLLVLAQVDSSQAVLATLGYRLCSYWAPLLAGPVAYGLFRVRYRHGPEEQQSKAPLSPNGSSRLSRHHPIGLPGQLEVPGLGVAPRVAPQPGVEELIERLGGVLLRVAGPRVVAGGRVPRGEAGREEEVGGERGEALLDRVAGGPGRVQQFVDGDVEDRVGVIADIGEEAGPGDSTASKAGRTSVRWSRSCRGRRRVA